MQHGKPLGVIAGGEGIANDDKPDIREDSDRARWGGGEARSTGETG